jgi:hypothetical protein
MMNQATRDFIRRHAQDDVRQLALRGTKDPEVDLPFALEQISGRQKARAKIPSWAALDGIVYPPHLSMEQCSSEQTARYKAELAGRGQLMADLTGGFGVDFALMAPAFEHAVYIEQNPQLCAISSENFATLGLRNTEVVCGDGTEYLHCISQADLIFIDPARRDSHGARTYSIADCTPNVLEVMGELREKARCVMLKLSPMLDWRKAVADIGGVSQVHIVSVDNECKELLLLINSERFRVVCVNLSSTNIQRFEFDATDTVPPPTIHYSLSTIHYLFEPNASVMKAGCFGLLAERFGVGQLEANSHLFVSDSDVEDFPGRRFVVESTCSLNKRELKSALTGIERANIAVRNFPMTVDQLKRKLKLKDGGDIYIFATTVHGERHQLFICRKIG